MSHPIDLIPSRKSLAPRSCSRSWVSLEATSGWAEICTRGLVSGVEADMLGGRVV